MLSWFQCLFCSLVGYLSCADGGFVSLVSEKTNTPLQETIKLVYSATQHNATPSAVPTESLFVRF